MVPNLSSGGEGWRYGTAEKRNRIWLRDLTDLAELFRSPTVASCPLGIRVFFQGRFYEAAFVNSLRRI